MGNSATFVSLQKASSFTFPLTFPITGCIYVSPRFYQVAVAVVVPLPARKVSESHPSSCLSSDHVDISFSCVLHKWKFGGSDILSKKVYTDKVSASVLLKLPV